MPLIHIGESTHHQDQAITPMSLSTMSVSDMTAHRSWPKFQIRPAIDFGRFTRMLKTTTPA
jgi:hypothetical protein